MASEFVTEVNESEFEAEVLSSEKPVLVDFWASWCGPCRMLAPVVEEIASEMQGKVHFKKLNVDDNQSIAMNYQVMSIPTLILFKDGKEAEQIVGVQTKQAITNMITRHI